MLRSTDVQLFLLRIRYDTILDTLKANFEIIERRFCAAYKCDAVKKQKFKRADVYDSLAQLTMKKLTRQIRKLLNRQ